MFSRLPPTLKNWFRAHWICFVPFIMAEVVDWSAYFSASFIADYFTDVSSIKLKPRQEGLSGFAKEFPYLSQWASSAMILGIVGSYLFVFANHLLLRTLNNRPQRTRRNWLVAIWGLCIAFVAICFGLGLFDDLGPKTTMIVLQQTSDQLNSCFVEQMGTVGNVFAFLVCWALAAAFGVLLAPPADGENWTLDHVETLAERMSAARILLYFSGLFLMIGVFQIASTNRLILAWVDKSDQQHLQNLATQYAALAGAVFTLVLVSLYVPVQYYLSRWADELAALGRPYGPRKVRDEWLELQGLKVSVKSQTTAVLAALAPIFGSGPLKMIVDYTISAN